jgi:hypothetical protein
MAAIGCPEQRWQGSVNAPTPQDRRAGKGSGRLTLNQGALVETLIQLSEFRQYEMAESILATCDREQLQHLLIVSDRAFSRRMAYSLEKQWERSKDVAYKAKKSTLSVVMNIFNTWCKEGRRSAIRCVLGEMHEQDLGALSELDDLDREVYSMLREYLFL